MKSFRTAGLAVLALLSLGLHCGASVHFSSPEMRIALARVERILAEDAVCSGAFQRMFDVDAAELLASLEIEIEAMNEGIVGKTRCYETSRRTWFTVAASEYLVNSRRVRMMEHFYVHELGHAAHCLAGEATFHKGAEMDIGALMEVLCYGHAELKAEMYDEDYCESG